VSAIESIGNASLIRVGEPSQSPIYNNSQQVAVVYSGNTLPLFWRNGPRYEISGANLQTALQTEVVDGSIYLLEESKPTFSYQVYKHDLITGVLTAYWDTSKRGWSDGIETAEARAIYGFDTYEARFQQFRSDFSGVFNIPQHGSGSVGSDANGDTASKIPVSSPAAFTIDNAEIITGFNPRSQTIQIDLGSFDGALGRLRIVKNKKNLDKLANTDTDFIYNRQSGYLYYNQNGDQPGFGDGGIIAILEGRPRVTTSSFEVL